VNLKVLPELPHVAKYFFIAPLRPDGRAGAHFAVNLTKE
jgi:hypothetical protein